MTPRQVFDALDVKMIDEWIANEREENLHLDFKTVRATMNKSDRVNLAVALSGFANSDGGVIVWGVDARKNARGVDCAAKKEPVAPVSQLISQLNDFTADSANPIVDGVVHRAIPDTGDSGYAVTLVPESKSGPHMAKAGEDRYYKRSGSRFVVMEHFDIADMFGRRPQADLRLAVRLATGSTIGGPEGTKRQFHVFIGIENTGRGTARAPYLGVAVNSPYEVSRRGMEGDPGDSLRPLARGRGMAFHRFGSVESIVIHPRTPIEVCSVSDYIPDSATSWPDLEISYEIAAENTTPQADKVTVRAEELIRLVRK